MQIDRIVIIGASGFLGSYLFSELSKNFIVIGTYFSVQNEDLYYLDMKNRYQVKRFFKKFYPNLVIVCGGITRPDECESNKKLAYEVNVKGIENIVNYCDCKLIYFSTDYVFDGKKGFYSENDVPNPINHYGRTKLKAEEIILSSGGDNVIIRVAGLYGYNKKNNEFLNSFESSVVYKAIDIFGSTLIIDDVMEHLQFFTKGQGIYHLASGSRLSRYDFALMVTCILGLPTKVVGKPSNEIYHIAKRPRIVSLISVKHKLKVCKEKEGLHRVKEYLMDGGR